jgi:hypothetical protein
VSNLLTIHGADDRTLHVRKATRAEPETLAKYQALNLNTQPRAASSTDRVNRQFPMSSM